MQTATPIPPAPWTCVYPAPEGRSSAIPLPGTRGQYAVPRRVPATSPRRVLARAATVRTTGLRQPPRFAAPRRGPATEPQTAPGPAQRVPPAGFPPAPPAARPPRGPAGRGG